MSQLEKYQMYIGGAWVDPLSAAWLESDNPYDGKAWALIPRGNEEDANRAVAAAKAAFTGGDWPRMNATSRGALLRRLGDLVARDAERLSAVEVRDNGKLISEMSAQLKYVPQWYYYFGGLADKVEGTVIPTDKANMFNYTRHEPLGVVAAITAWNSPLLLAAYKLAPALAAGNTVVLKPSEYTSASALEFAKLVEEAGFPPGVVNVATGLGREIGEALISHPDVAKVAFTGGSATGRHIYETAAAGPQARHPRAWRQVSQHRVRRRGSRGCGEGGNLRHLRGNGANLRRGLSFAAARAHPRRVLSTSYCRPRRRRVWAIRWMSRPRWVR